MKITKDMRMNEILNLKGKKAEEILVKLGMHCVGCPMAMQETLEDGCRAHGFNKKEIDKIIEKLNKIK